MDIEEFIDGLKIEEPYFLRNLVIVPLKSERDANGFATLDEALNSGELVVEDSGEVEIVYLNYGGSSPLFVLDGEEVVGALQNRVFNTSFVVEERRVEAPVTCVEQGRWSGGRVFKSSLTSAYPSLRAILASSVTESLESGIGFKSNQGLVWKSVRDTLKSLNVKSMTLSMHDAFDVLEDDIERYVEELEIPERSVGFIAFSGKEFVGMDVFGSSKLFEKLGGKLVSSYALEALMRKDGGFPEDEEIRALLSELREIQYREFPSLTSGVELRARTENLVAKGLKREGEVIHFSAFPLPEI